MLSPNPIGTSRGEKRYRVNCEKKKKISTQIKLQDLVYKLYTYLQLHGELDLALQPKLHLMLDLPKTIDKRRLYEAVIQLECFGHM